MSQKRNDSTRTRWAVRRKLEDLRSRVLLFGTVGLGFGLALAGYATFVRVFIGNHTFEINGTTYSGTIATYILGGTAAGVVVAMLYPLTRWRWGSAIVGFVAAVPIYTGAFLVTGGFDIAGILICALVTGGAVGYLRFEWE